MALLDAERGEKRDEAAHRVSHQEEGRGGVPPVHILDEAHRVADEVCKGKPPHAGEAGVVEVVAVPRVVHGVHGQTLLRPRLAERLVAQRMLAVPVKQYDDGSQGHRLWRQPGVGVAPPAGGRFKPEILAEADRADER